MASPSPMNAGIDIHSYAKNSRYQRDASKATMDTVKDVILQSLDVNHILTSSNTTFSIADLGCSTGPNTFFAMQDIVEAVESKYSSILGLKDSKNLEFQVLFNDQTENDFNMLFASLPPNRRYFAAGVPGSFYGRLFPTSSVHFAYSAFALHWLSRAPEELLIRESRACNAGKIHYMGASDGVVKAYSDQFERDMEIFLSARAQEIVPGGMIVILMVGTEEGVLMNPTGKTLAFLEAILMEMVQEGLVDQDQVDAFNIPTMFPSVIEMKRLVVQNGLFSVEKMELRSETIDSTYLAETKEVITQIRAVYEGTFVKHFGRYIVDDIFNKAEHLITRLYDSLNLSEETTTNNTNLFVVLKRK